MQRFVKKIFLISVYEVGLQEVIHKVAKRKNRKRNAVCLMVKTKGVLVF